MFGTSGIRGLYGEEITEELAFKVANAFASNPLFVGRDLRESSLPLALAAMSGGIAAGGEMIDLGECPTGMVAFASKKGRGIMITASHNPPSYNGFKLFEEGGEIGKTVQKEVLSALGKVKRGKGGGYRRDALLEEDYLSALLRLAELKKPLKIVLSNYGPGAAWTERALSEAGAQVIAVTFPRTSEPTAEVQEKLRDYVKRYGADLGIAHDGDGDRCVIVTDRLIPSDAQLAALATRYKKVILTKECSMAVLEEVEKRGAAAKLVEVGSTYVGERLREEGYEFGGEPCGEYIFPSLSFAPDGTAAALLFAQLVAEGEDFNYPNYFMKRLKFAVKDKDAVMERLKEVLGVEEGERMEMREGWFMIRRSGTEPVIRLTVEARQEEELKKAVEQLRNSVEAVIDQVK